MIHCSNVVSLLCITVFYTIDQVYSSNNDNQVARWKVSLDGLSNAESSQALSTTVAPNKNIRLIDWREWQLMKGYNHPSGDSHPPMLIVSPEEVIIQSKTPLANLPAEAFEDDTAMGKEVEENVHIQKSMVIPKDPTVTSTTTPTSTITSAATTTTVSPSTSATPWISSSSVPPLPPIANLLAPSEGLDLKNLPNFFMLLKQLALIPAVVKSLSGGAAAGAPLTSAATSSSHSLFGMLTGSALDSGANNAGVITSPGLHSQSKWKGQMMSKQTTSCTLSEALGNVAMPHPIVPVMTTYDSGKIRRPTEPTTSTINRSN
uniref:Uncharacterized protein n=1 Tax=Ditylenchus dipsaci TaxID=166011 RepID=A0A915DX36_9BILA